MFVPRPALAVATALALVAAVPVPSRADAGTWTVSPGGAVSATAPAEIRNTTKNWTIGCTATFSGTAPAGAGHSPYGLISFDQGSLTACAGPNALTTTSTVVNLPWDFYAGSYDAVQGRTSGTLNNLALTLDVSNGCRADVSAPDGAPGTTDAAYANAGGTLTLSGAHMKVTFTNYRCTTDLVAPGDQIELAAVLPLTPAQTITSP
ncbi:hypothetical protein OHR68_04595 [Spirillospora sp. NBC_00431]